MPGPVWDDDDPRDRQAIAANAQALVRSFVATAARRERPTVALVCSWHERIYDGCHVPSIDYRGGLRGDPARPDLFDYEVGVGPIQADGLPENVGVWSAGVPAAVEALVGDVREAVAVLDVRFPVGTRPASVEELDTVVSFLAAVHGEWVRVHPFANGNGRTARAFSAWLCLRYGLPVFVSVAPRPHDVAYSRAARTSMGRPPDFVGDHTETAHVFVHLLTLALMP